MNLYEINAEILNCMDEVDEETGELLNWEKLDALVMERDKKIEGIACWIKDLIAEGKALKEEKDSFAKRQKAAENKAEQLKKYLTNALQGEKFKTEKVAISWKKSESVEVKDWKQLEDDYLRYKEPEVDKTAVKIALKNGLPLNGVRLVEKKNIQIK
ncbi:siphovirus Gp157 family protein [Velocimicrobium porci]|uniref:Siphovirus Gp157 family protein n=1 Tax=Velocimicrobium porci TaxID=2606634 RepID=A0A6L5Y0Q6_9FIRM|nr:siphovirus Gp157 family protein [Velocimicrobium porci]MSS64572.1 siphovirus Gp157 family protein [Velocimicrobium porci]